MKHPFLFCWQIRLVLYILLFLAILLFLLTLLLLVCHPLSSRGRWVGWKIMILDQNSKILCGQSLKMIVILLDDDLLLDFGNFISSLYNPWSTFYWLKCLIEIDVPLYKGFILSVWAWHKKFSLEIPGKLGLKISSIQLWDKKVSTPSAVVYCTFVPQMPIVV